MKIVLFDIDDTLLVCPPGSNALASRMMFKKLFNLDADEELIDHVGKTDKAIIGDVLEFKGMGNAEELDIPTEAFKGWADALGDLLKKSPAKILPGAEEILKALSEKEDILLTILTGNSPYRATAKLESAGLDKYFRDENGKLRGVFGDTTRIRAELIDHAEKEFGEGTYIIVDDSIIAAKMAKEKEVPSILVATGSASLEELKKYSEFVFPDFADGRWEEVVKIIEKLS